MASAVAHRSARRARCRRSADPALPFVAASPLKYSGTVVGNGHCVHLVQRACGAPQTSLWRRGAQVLSGEPPAYGTAVATFGEAGGYENKTDGSSHAAIFVKREPGFIRVYDQWRGKPAGERTIYDRQGRGLPVDDASRYHVVEQV